MRFTQCIVGLASLAAMSACSTYSLEQLRHTTPKGTPFQAALALKYLQFSEDEARNYDWADSGYFADKGLSAAYGNDVAPENPAQWNIPPSARGELEQAYEALNAALAEHKAAQPQLAADAQFYFDCWVENQDEAWEASAISECKDNFAEAMKGLAGGGVAAQQPVVESKEDIVPEPEEKPVKDAYIVFFATDRAELDDKGERLVDAVVEDVKKNQHDDNYVVVVNGHTDTVGMPRYNFELSKRRAESVAKALVKRGIPQKSVRALGFGETDLKIRTKDGVAEPGNRRVEIFTGD